MSSSLGIDYRKDIAGEATKLVGALAVITTFVERSTAVLGSIWFDEPISLARSRLEAARLQLKAAPSSPDVQKEFAAAGAALSLAEAGKSRLRLYAALFIALLVSAAGVRTLERLQHLEGVLTGVHAIGALQLGVYRSTDVLITAGLIAGGSAGIAAIADLIARSIQKTLEKLQAS